MAGDFLSQEEVDALLRGVCDPEDAHEPSYGAREPRPYHLGTQERIVRGRMPALEYINERFARYLRVGLFNYMHRNAEISVGPVRVQKYSEFIRNLVVPTGLNLVKAQPLQGTGLIVVDPNLLYLVVDNMFGGDGRFHCRMEGRDFTATELQVLDGLVKTVMAEYARAWAPVRSLDFEVVGREMNTQFANIATPSEIVVSTTFTLEFGGATADLHFCWPYTMLEPLREVLCRPFGAENLLTPEQKSEARRRLESHLPDLGLEVACVLGEVDVSLARLMHLSPGEVLPLQTAAYLAFEGRPMARLNYNPDTKQISVGDSLD